MTKRITAKHKIDRRLGLNLWGRVKSPFNRRQSRPGQHGTRGRKLSDFGIHLMAKQKLKGYYANLSERQFRRFFEEAQRRKGDTSENLIGLLERRLDTVVYRAKFVPTMFAARQFVNHGHVLVNGRRVNIGSYLVNDNDVISVREKSQQLTSVLGSVESQEREVPEYLDINHKTMTCKYLRAPKMMDVPYPVQMEPNLVVEYYSQ